MANVTVVEEGLVEMREKVFQLMQGTHFTAVVFNEVSNNGRSSSCLRPVKLHITALMRRARACMYLSIYSVQVN